MGSKAKNDVAGKEATSRVQFYQKTGLIHTYTVESTYYKGEFNKENMENENSEIYLIKDFEKTGIDLLKSILDYEKLFLSDNLLRSEYQTLENTRKHIAQIVKFNEDRFKFNYGLKDFINNIEEQKKWMTIKEINDARTKFRTQMEENKNNLKKKKAIKKRLSIDKNKTNINLRNITKIEDSKMNIVEDINVKIVNKTNRTPFLKNDIMLNKVKIENKKDFNNLKKNKIPFGFNFYPKKEKESKNNKNNDDKNKKILKPIKKSK